MKRDMDLVLKILRSVEAREVFVTAKVESGS